MDGNSDTTDWGALETRIIAAQVAARVVALAIDEALDRITCIALNTSTADMLRQTHEVAKAFKAISGKPQPGR